MKQTKSTKDSATKRSAATKKNRQKKVRSGSDAAPTKKKVSGASRKTKRANASNMALTMKWVYRMAASVIFFIGVGYAAYAMKPMLEGKLHDVKNIKPLLMSKIKMDQPIKNIDLHGDFGKVNREAMLAALKTTLEMGFFDVDIDTLKTEVERHPWIDKVNISRRWPDRLIVTVYEQQAIARWGHSAFLNQRGEVVHVGKTDDLQSLPLLIAKDHYAKDVMQQYLGMNQLLWQANLHLSALQLDGTQEWVLTVSPNTIIRLGKDNVIEKLHVLLTIDEQVISAKLPHIAQIDMRYEKGFAIKWVDDSEPVHLVQEKRIVSGRSSQIIGSTF